MANLLNPWYILQVSIFGDLLQLRWPMKDAGKRFIRLLHLIPLVNEETNCRALLSNSRRVYTGTFVFLFRMLRVEPSVTVWRVLNLNTDTKLFIRIPTVCIQFWVRTQLTTVKETSNGFMLYCPYIGEKLLGLVFDYAPLARHCDV